MESTWILVANASQARCYERAGRKTGLMELARLEHALGRAKGRDLATDRPGRETLAATGGASTYAPRLDARQKERGNFARLVGEYLNQAVAAGRCERVLLFASNPFLGEIKQHLDERARACLKGSLSLDLTAYEGRDLERRIDRGLEQVH
jgi:protein required for attachment to host cells